MRMKIVHATHVPGASADPAGLSAGGFAGRVGVPPAARIGKNGR